MCMALRIQPKQMLEQDGRTLNQCIAAATFEDIYIGANGFLKVCTFIRSMCPASLDCSQPYITCTCLRGHTIQQDSCFIKDPSV